MNKKIESEIDDQGDGEDPKAKLVRTALEALSQDWETVQILCSTAEKDGSGDVVMFQVGKGLIGQRIFQAEVFAETQRNRYFSTDGKEDSDLE